MSVPGMCMAFSRFCIVFIGSYLIWVLLYNIILVLDGYEKYRVLLHKKTAYFFRFVIVSGNTEVYIAMVLFFTYKYTMDKN